MGIFQIGWKNFKSFWTADGFFNCKGRISRKEYWSTFLVYFLFSFCFTILDGIFNVHVFSAIWLVASIVPYTCLSVRRLHDINFSGWWILAKQAVIYLGIIVLASIGIKSFISHFMAVDSFIFYDGFRSLFFVSYCVWGFASIVFSIFTLVLHCLRGNAGINKYGENPQRTIADFVDDKKINVLSEDIKVKILKCAKCGKVISVLSDSDNPETICCGQEMILMKANTSDGAVEKHVPVIEKNGNEVVVKVGSAAHPMTAEHYIDWIMLVGSNNVQISNVRWSGNPEAKFILSDGEEIKNVYAYCNLHGLWSIK